FVPFPISSEVSGRKTGPGSLSATPGSHTTEAGVTIPHGLPAADHSPGRDAVNLASELRLLLTRRQLFGRPATGIGTAALASLLNERLFAADADAGLRSQGALSALHFAPKAKRVIYLFMSGGPSHIDLFDYKPKLKDYHGQE